jgi:hypothetical protein
MPPFPNNVYMTSQEKRLAWMWWQEDDVPVAQIAQRLHRNRSTVWDLLRDDEEDRRGVGRHKALTEHDKDHLVELVDKMVLEADTRYTVTLSMIHARFEPKVCERVLADALHERDRWFYKLREKPILTDQDVRDRYAFAKKYRRRTAAWWRAAVHLHIDNHAVKVPKSDTARRYLAARRVHGTYRSAGKSLQKQHVKAGRGLRKSAGEKSVLVAGGVGVGKVLLWENIDENWSGRVAADLYSGPTKKCLKKAYPAKRSWQVLEDNDPSGYKAKRAIEAKVAAKITAFEIPKRSPDLNVMDYFVWSEVESRLRKQERRWAPGRVESRADFKKRLRRVAKNIPTDVLDKAVGDMAWRVQQVFKAKGGLFEEGGRKPV